MRLIDADELKIYISTTFCDTCKRDKGVCSSCAFDDVFIAIEDAPTIDAEPVTYTFDVKSDKCEECAYKKTVEELSKGFEDYIIHGERR